MNISRRGFLLGGGASILLMPGIASYVQEDKGVELPRQRSGGDSLWFELSAQSNTLPTLENDTSADVCIVGGGYTGLAASIYLKKYRPDWRVLVLESHHLGAGASSRNSGAVYAKFTGMDDRGLAERGLQRFMAFLEEESIDCDFQAAKTLYLYSSESSARDARQSLSQGERWLDHQALKHSIASDFYIGAKASPGFYKIQPAGLLSEYRRVALALGVEIYERSPVLAIESGHSNTLTTDKAAVLAKQVLLATNAYTPRLGVAGEKMFPVHQYSCSTAKLNVRQIDQLGLNDWDLRFEPNTLPITFGLSASGHFFLRLVLGYASQDSTEWLDVNYARALVQRIFQERYPHINQLGIEHEWHGVTAHTLNSRSVVSNVLSDTIFLCGAYNGLGIMPSHYSAYLIAQKMTGNESEDWQRLTRLGQHVSFPRDYYRSLMLKSSFNLLNRF
ncbi:NAD(P)/FAD-dependent oxidoreductase [Pseudoteredinibacter isoporae]|uniref:Glycine/D-amino acid oxidase-like deaminating enzyme n=1 Tax=Pseudoteredinibacter isoporae TaxID=570281 RepID=A0A7X0JRC9_9GAMM|nr:FAD-binding oxidoreductase [Pseudoteredinibacter isoporae]MBB6520884.1 glycine/D-amino acid oxidase-like deaminating enzyme [Pseudoteredinibacter isoporae]NHO86449.1 FAD-binding oxidoreductase [Pseudoteredinibacter isoporae]NIB25099.1 FAD-binding oxidoreductase [Pseudoteredinibacter isoporae]